MSDINWYKADKDTQYEPDATYLLDCMEGELELAEFCVDDEGGKLWMIEHEVYEFDDIKIDYYAKARSGKVT